LQYYVHVTNLNFIRMKYRRVISISFILIIILTSFLLNSCSDDSNPAAPPAPNTSNLIRLDSNFAIGGRASVSFYVEDTLRVGYNNIYIVLYDSVTKGLITDAHVEFMPTNHGHSTPVEDPPQAAVDGIFKGAIILNESQPITDHWHYLIGVHNHQAPGEPEGEVEFEDFRVKENPDKFKSIIMPDSTPLYLSYIKPKNPVTGLNDFEFLINRNEPELFPPDGSFTIEMIPEFLSDGHTTNGNINPVGSANGHYTGKFNLDRNGAWRIKLKVIKNNIFYDTYFDINY